MASELKETGCVNASIHTQVWLPVPSFNKYFKTGCVGKKSA